VRLFDAKNTVVEPDIVVVCDRSKLDGKVVNGAPDMVVEVTSPSTAKYDKHKKLKLYQSAGVKEYWIADPDLNMIQVFLLDNGQYTIRSYSYPEDSSVQVSVLNGCEIDLNLVFGESNL
jgi:Uma2 family endonuclease